MQRETGLRGRHISLAANCEDLPGHDVARDGTWKKKRRRWLTSPSVVWSKVACVQSPAGKALVGTVTLIFLVTLVSWRRSHTEITSSNPRTFPRVVVIVGNGVTPLRFSRKYTFKQQTIDFRQHKQKRSESSEHYKTSGQCRQMHEWQSAMFPTCNKFHEVDLSERDYLQGNGHPRGSELLNSGHFRDVWSISEFDGVGRVLKTLRIKYRFSVKDIEKERRDGIAMERLTSSPHIPDIFGYCVASGLFELSTEGDLMSHVWDDNWRAKTTKRDRLTIALQVAAALADVHDMDIAHTDVAPKQYILIDGIYKLNDFNRCEFLQWDEVKKKACKFYISGSPGVGRSPEEYKYEYLTNKIDVYSMGNVFYSLLMEMKVFHGVKSKKVKKIVMGGKRPRLHPILEQSTDAVDVALIRAMRMSQEQDPRERASAREVYEFLLSEAKNLGVPEVLGTK